VAALNLRTEALRLAGSLSEMLNNTVCHGIRLRAIIRNPIAGVKSGMNIGYNITEQIQDLRAGIPLTISKKPAKFYLGFFMHLQLDDARKYMMVTQSMTLLALDADLSRELLHYDYEREKHLEGKGYPEAHLQVCAPSADWEIAGQRSGQDNLPLAKMHLPVGPGGGRRFRPSLEDVIEFLIVEGLVEHRKGWREALDKTRRPFQEIQLKAAVRENKELAKEALESEGWTVTRSDS
jgi:hypothetical protein